MEQQNKLKLSDITTLALGWQRALRGGDKSADELEHRTNTAILSIQIRESLTLREKFDALADIMASISSPNLNALEATQTLVMSRFFYGLLRYATNLDVDMNMATAGVDVMMSVYDLLTSFIHLDDYLLGKGEYKNSAGCAEDYAKLDKMVDEMNNYANVFNIVKMASYFNPKNLEKIHKDLEKYREDLTPDMIDKLKGVVVEGSPEWEALRKTLGEEAAAAALYTAAKQLSPQKEAEARESQVMSAALDASAKDIKEA